MPARRCLPLALLLLILPGVAAAQELPADARAIHALNRLSFGPTPGELDRVRAMGVEAYVREQLNPEALPEPPELLDRLGRLPTQAMDAVRLFRAFGPKPAAGVRTSPSMDEIKVAREKAQVIVREAAEAKILRAVLSPRQLQEILCDFWYNHFSVSAAKGLSHLWVGAYEHEAIRPHVLGRFADILAAANRHPAMLVYLDNWQSASPDSPAGKGVSRPLIELQAREILAGQTLGPSAGGPAAYKPQDVTTLARVLAGWTLGAPRHASDKNGVTFDERRHDQKPKVFLGKPLKGHGAALAQEAFDTLAAEPATARHITRKLARHFLAEEPPKALEERLAQVFLDSKGDIRLTLAALFAAPEFWDAKYAANLYKPPLRCLASTLRASGRPLARTDDLGGLLAGMGMSLYEAPSPAGFRNTREAWLTPEFTLKRLAFAAKAGEGLLACWFSRETPWRYRPPEPLDAQALIATAGLTLSPPTRQTLDECSPKIRAAALLGAPEWQLY